MDLGGGYNRNAANVILAEVQRNFEQSAVDQLINDMDLEPIFGFNKGQTYW